ncbi:MAG: hypothetical protein ACT4ON_12025 [Bacteroidota bacterium]
METKPHLQLIQQRQLQQELKQLQPQLQQIRLMNKQNNLIQFILLSITMMIITSCGNGNKVRQNLTKDIIDKYQKNPQVYYYMPDSAFSVIGKEGTRISILANSFLFEDGTSPKEKIEITLKECYSPSDIVFNNLSTQMNDCLLQTGGMIFFEAKSEKKVLKLKEGKSIEIGFPVKNEYETGMQLYKGSFDKGYLKWDEVIVTDVKRKKIVKPLDVENSPSSFSSEEDSLKYYLFDSQTSGWLNCDKKLEGQDKTILTVITDSSITPNIRLVFNDLRVAAFPIKENGNLIFYNIPLGKKASLIGFYKENEKIFMYRKDIVVVTNAKENALFNESSIEQLKAEADKMQWCK